MSTLNLSKGQFVIFFIVGLMKGIDLTRLREHTSQDGHGGSNTRGPPAPAYGRRLTEQDDDAEQDGHQGARGEAVGEGQDLRAAGLHVAAAVACTHAHDERAGAALDRVVVVRDHHGQEVQAHLTPAEAPPPRQDVGGVV